MTSANQSTDDEAIRAALPEPSFWVAVDPTRHSMYQAYRTMAAMRRRASEGDRFEAAFTRGQMVTAVKAALERAEKAEPRSDPGWNGPMIEEAVEWESGDGLHRTTDRLMAEGWSRNIGCRVVRRAAPESITQPEPRTPEQALDAMVRDAAELGLYDEPAQAQEARPLVLDEEGNVPGWYDGITQKHFESAVREAVAADRRAAAAPAQEAPALSDAAAIARQWGDSHEPHISVNARNAGSKIARAIERLAAQSHPAPPIPEAPCAGQRGEDVRGCWNVRCQLGKKCIREAPAGDKR